MKRATALLLVAATVSITTASAQILTEVFSDNFESASMANWTTTGSSALEIDGLNVNPGGGAFSARMNVSTDRMHRNIIGDNGGSEVAGAFVFTSYMFDASGTATRFYNEVRGYAGTGLPNGGTVADGALSQLFAIGKHNTVTLAGETFSGSKYQARVTFGTSAGWFNLNGPDSPNRSTGWHKFTIERLDDLTTINFYVDDVLSRTITGATDASIDTLILGPGLGSTVGDAWFDGVSIANVTPVPEPGAFAAVFGGLALAGALLRRRLQS